jgi:hypothetical protein
VKKHADCTSRNNEIRSVLFVLIANIQNITGLKADGVMNVKIAEVGLL